jgi:hypothetical protein
MIKKTLIIVAFLVTISGFSQEATSSPYSFYGIGDIKFKGTVENRSMGGLSVFRDSIHINLQNPASFASLKLTTFTIGGNQNESKLSTSTADDSARRTTLDYLAVGLPFGKYAFSFGLIPYSAIGYNIQSLNEAKTEQNNYKGSGGLNKVYVGFGYNLNKNWSIGASFEYNFGKISTNSVFTSSAQFSTQETNDSNGTGANFVTGVMYESSLKEKINYFGGFTFTPQSVLAFENTRTIRSQSAVFDNSIVLSGDAINSKINLPNKITIGFGLGQIRKWQIGAELVWKQSSNFGNRFTSTNSSYENSSKFILGGFYIPKYNSFRSYFERITYRGGLNYQNTGLIVNGKSINEQNISIGLGLPLGGTFSNLNFGAEYGKRGTRLAGLIEEKYFNFSIALTFNDRWFVKRKID